MSMTYTEYLLIQDVTSYLYESYMCHNYVCKHTVFYLCIITLNRLTQCDPLQKESILYLYPGIVAADTQRGFPR